MNTLKPALPRGVTLIELMVVIAIAAILYAVGTPSLQQFTLNRTADRLAQELQLDLAFARNQAITLNQEVRVEPNNNWSRGWIIRQNNRVIREKGSANNPMAEAGVITSMFTAATPLRFDPQGRAQPTGSFTIDVPGCSGNRERLININFIGQLVTQELLCQ